MGRRLKTAEGKKIYKKRKETVEPVFGIIKQAKRFPPVSAERARESKSGMGDRVPWV
jgi:hypothetical protein